MTTNWGARRDSIRPAECYDKDPDPLYGHSGEGCFKLLIGALPAAAIWAAMIVLWMQPWRP